MQGIEAIRPNVDEMELFAMPEVRVIGKALTCKLRDCGAPATNPVPAFWDRFFAEGCRPIVDALPHAIPSSMVGWTGNYVAETDTFVYIAGVLSPAGTPVPQGFDHRDLPASVVAKGLFGEDVHGTVARLRELGYEPVYTDLGWNAELYLDGDSGPAPTRDTWRWLVPCRQVAPGAPRPQRTPGA